jgi:hypothetical protein
MEFAQGVIQEREHICWRHRVLVWRYVPRFLILFLSNFARKMDHPHQIGEHIIFSVAWKEIGWLPNMLRIQCLCTTTCVLSIWSLTKHLKLDALAFNLAHLFHISIPHYPYLICNALLNFYAFFIYSPYPHKTMFRKHRFRIPVIIGGQSLIHGYSHEYRLFLVNKITY